MRYLVTEEDLKSVRGCGCCGLEPEHVMTDLVTDDTLLVTRELLREAVNECYDQTSDIDTDWIWNYLTVKDKK